ncbi:uncharacterized protein C5orf47 homolog [Budorcas taxicolor]|uniref:uncharacterized protein C5orf47 homolog n=1 Tax=Budorcas taxicolor TaxID=37181 RepID=UPI0022839617|nr:uncharacterized protein C5orf47 homolog [Budorcas taxicolor]
MAVAGRELARDRARFVYVTRFGSHQCGGVLPLGGRRAQGSRNAGLTHGHSQEKPRAAAPGNPGAGELRLGFRPGPSRPPPPRRRRVSPSRRRPAARAGGAAGWAGGACGPADLSVRFSSRLARGSSRLNGSGPLTVDGPPVGLGTESRVRTALRGCPEKPQKCNEGLTQKNLAKEFDFPVHLSETSKIMKKNKKVLVWNGVYKVISKMLEENEKYRLRLKCQQLSRENSKDRK